MDIVRHSLRTSTVRKCPTMSNEEENGMAKCSVCDKDVLINLVPDYASTGFWCGCCGVSYGQPGKDFPLIPDALITLVYGWNWLWESAVWASATSGINKEYFTEVFRKMGKELARQVNEFYPCVFDETQPVFQ
jgi:hypothetical protein